MSGLGSLDRTLTKGYALGRRWCGIRMRQRLDARIDGKRSLETVKTCHKLGLKHVVGEVILGLLCIVFLDSFYYWWCVP